MSGKVDNYEMQIAVVGMAGRFPGAKSTAELWRNICDGVESIARFSDEELLQAGVPAEILSRPGYVKAKGMLDDIEMFDTTLFGYSPQEAQILDPQQRIFLMCAHEALENAGYNSASFSGRIGVFAGAGFNTYIFSNVWPNRHRLAVPQGMIHGGNDKDYIATRVAYHLDLRGPAVTIQTACSSGLVATHFAAQSLLSGESDITLAGGCTINVPNKNGYLHHQGGILSPDGHCRPFDASARGTVNGNACAIVVLKRMADAVADRDTIHGVLLASTINNDGARKVGFTAPSVEGQAKVVAEALAVAGVSPDTIGYVEAHGTGTEIGDPIEIEALTQAFRAGTQRKQYCAIGSLKSNIGHTDTASGVASLIKALCVVKNGVIPPSINFERPNPDLSLADSPFYVNTRLADWKPNGSPRRAGVSSFGVGGTNAHVIVQQPPTLPASPPVERWRLITISAKTLTALDAATRNLAAHLEQTPELDLGDVAYTLTVGRRQMPVRRVLVSRSVNDAAAALKESSPARVLTQQTSHDRTVAFMFPGQGAQHPGMGADLYREDKGFRENVDRCSEILRKHIDFDIRGAIEGSPEITEQILQQTAVAQPALFVLEYALARLWMSLGVRPAAMIGHSVGEYVAACLAGVFSLEGALEVVAARGRLMQGLPPGAMLAVGLPAEELALSIDSRLSVAAINAPSNTVLSGPIEVVESLEQRLSQQGVWHRRLHTSHAFHSDMMDPVLDAFAAAVGQQQLRAPEIPFISSVTGTWISRAAATDPRYWAKQLRQTVQFQNGIYNLTQGHPKALLEVGPGRVLCVLARQRVKDCVAVASLRQKGEAVSDLETLLTSAGRLWLSGVKLDWEEFWSSEPRCRIPLPTYPFEGRRYWLDAPNQAPAAAASEPAEEEPHVSPSESTQNEELHPRPNIGVAYVPPETEIEKRIAAVWQDCLAINPVGIHDNFLELGGNSLMATQIVARLRDLFPIDLQVETLITDQQTIARLAVHIEELLVAKLEQMSDEEAHRLL